MIVDSDMVRGFYHEDLKLSHLGKLADTITSHMNGIRSLNAS